MTDFNSLRCKTRAENGCETALIERCNAGNGLLAMIMLLSVAAHSERVGAQTFSTIYAFSGLTPPSPPNIGFTSTNSDGAGPWCTLALSGNTLYGTAAGGGSSGEGTVFKVQTDGSGFVTLHSFSVAADLQPVNYDGINPMAGLTLYGNTLYGTAFSGGSGANGTVFSVITNGDNFQTLYAFTRFAGARTNSDGANPFSELVLSGNVLLGSTYGGGPTEDGSLFKVSADGSGFAVFGSVPNMDGPESALVLSNDILYGTSFAGGTLRNGTVFRINIDGTGFTALYNFTGASDGAHPSAGLLLSGNVLYGTTTAGGTSGQGTVFKLNTDGTSFATLHSLAGSDGAPNRGALVLVGHNLFGIASVFPQGGTVYTLNTNGTGFTVLHRFTGPGDPTGGQPQGGLTASASMLYGTTSLGGSAGNGTIFVISLLPQLAIIPLGQNVLLTWPTNYAGVDYTGYNLQSASSLSSPVWTTNSRAPVVVNGQCVVTNPISGAQKFYRLSQ